MILIVDCPYVCHKVRHGMRGIDMTSEQADVEVIFGFLKQLLMICKRFQNINEYVFCWDSSKSKRLQLYPEYKANRRNREKTEEEKNFDKKTMDQFKVLRRYVLPMMGFENVFIQTGVESDDVIASVVRNYPMHMYMLITSDSDMYQLLDENLRIYSLHTRKVMDKKLFTETYGIEPNQWATAKAIGGCVTDNVEGIRGVADPAKSVKSLALAYLRGQLTKGKIKEKIESEEGQKIIARNMQLVSLPFYTTDRPELIHKSLWKRDFLKTFEKYNFLSFMRSREFYNWEYYLNLN